MPIYNIDNIKNDIEKITDEIIDSHKPALITTDKGNMVILSEEDYNSIRETLYLCSIPNMKESILEADKENIKDCSDSLDW